MRVALYARYSTDLQNERSIEDQIASCQRLLERNGWAVGAIYADHAISAASMATRPELQRLIADMRARRIDVVVAEAIDRLSRDQADIALIHRWAELAGVKIYTLSEGEIGLLQVGLAGTMAHMFLKQLGEKTRRGMEGRVRAGRSAGGRCYGYALVPGDVGARVIAPEEAEIIRRIYAQYAVGVSPRALAHTLNREGVPGPSGKEWTQSSINGDRRVGDGILCNELYRGVLVFGRRKFVKDPETGRRRGIVQPKKDWLRTEAPELRIVDDELWARVQKRREGLSSLFHPNMTDINEHRVPPRALSATRRPKRLLSGLLRCGVCGGGLTIIERRTYGCSASRERGLTACTNRRMLSTKTVDERVVSALKRYLLAPDQIAEAVKAFQAETTRLARDAKREAYRVQQAYDAAKRRLDRVVDLLIDGDRSPVLVARMRELEAELERLAGERDAYAPEEAVALHPGAADFYRIKVEHLSDALRSDTMSVESVQSVRELIDHVMATPLPDGAWDLVVHGRLAMLLSGQNENPAGRSGGVSVSGVTTAWLGAGAGFEPTTFRL